MLAIEENVETSEKVATIISLLRQLDQVEEFADYQVLKTALHKEGIEFGSGYYIKQLKRIVNSRFTFTETYKSYIEEIENAKTEEELTEALKEFNWMQFYICGY